MKYFAGLVVLVALAGAGFYYFSPTAEAPTEAGEEQNGGTTQAVPAPGNEDVDEMVVSDGTENTEGTDTGGAPESGADGATVSYTADGFEPQTVEISVGETVTWRNESGGGMWVASAVHPTHTNYGGTTLSEHCPDADSNDFDQCESGSEYSFTFEKAGEWKYHNHVRASHTGTVIVTE